MRAWKKIVILTVLAAMEICSLWGCGMSAKGNIEEVRIKEPENHLASWRKELPRDGEYTIWDASAVRGLEIQKDGETVFAVSYEPREGKESFDYWDISEPYQSMVSVNTEELYGLFDTIFQLRWDQTRDISLEDAGIADSDSSVFIAYNREQRSGEKGAEDPTGTRTILIGDPDGQGNYYAALEGTEEVAAIDQTLVDGILNIDPYQYILKLPVLISVDTVEKVQILSDGKTHRMESGDGTWKLDNKSVEQGEFQSLYGKLLDVMLSGGITEKAPGNGKSTDKRQPVLTIQFIRNIDEASDIEVIYYEYDECSMSVSVNGREYFLVDKENVHELMKNIEESF